MQVHDPVELRIYRRRGHSLASVTFMSCTFTALELDSLVGASPEELACSIEALQTWLSFPRYWYKISTSQYTH